MTPNQTQGKYPSYVHYSTPSFKFWQIANIYHNFLFPHDYLIYHNVWLRMDENWRKRKKKSQKCEKFEILMKKKFGGVEIGFQILWELSTKFG